jgi:hypothetical protein
VKNGKLGRALSSPRERVSEKNLILILRNERQLSDGHIALLRLSLNDLN